jgi:hypothetical protein
MAHFNGEVWNVFQTTKGTKKGSKYSGLEAQIMGQDVGIKISAFVNGVGEDCIAIYKMEGSNKHSSELIALITKDKTELNE